MFIEKLQLTKGIPMPKAGEQMMVEVQNESGDVLHQRIHDLVATEAPGKPGGLALKAILKEEKYLDANFRKASTEPVLKGTEEAAVAAAKLAWDIFKDGKPITDLNVASTSILNPAETNPFNYSEAKPAHSGTYYMSAYNWPFKNWKAFEVWVRVSGTYNGHAPEKIGPGLYLPSIFVEFPKTPWCEWGFTLKGSTMVSNPSNIGKQNNVIAFCDLRVSINASSLVDDINQTFAFRATGDKGFVRI